MKKYLRIILYICLSVVLLVHVGLITDRVTEYFALTTADVDIQRAVLAPVICALVGGLVFVKRHSSDE